MALPDYPSLKRDISSALFHVMRTYRDAQLGPFAKSPRMYYREGDRADYSTVQGDVKEVEFRELSFQQELTLSDLPTMTHDEVLGVVASIGSDFGTEVAKTFYESLGNTLEDAGQTISSQGQPIDAEFLLRVLESLEIGFDDEGNPNPLDMVGGSPDLRQQIVRIQNEDESFQQRAQALIDRKREQWVARESNRKLVD
ncbi:hypothetical protein [Jidongwangia harbinensis]|uniref:hypothetical protein n=1 Tax=Jidongwangia harbinensis TaxID=2878561 RepID=UPI001CD9561A|nr:hypothetical protein [Jidongwangia harbinensis]MCA2215809.1 hypothetical protein [Jidongwangia harbinensis]